MLNSNSKRFLNIISESLDNYDIYDLRTDKYQDILESINKNKVIVMAFPLYVDAPTSLVLEFMDYIYDNKINLKSKKLYVIINCGFLEWNHNITALNIIKRWCAKANIEYMGSLLIGAGEVICNSDNKIINKKALRDIKNFSKYIKNCDKKEFVTGLKFVNAKIFVYAGNIFWKKKCKLNNLSYSEIK